jgi:GNAT superfamily N-acetyltransferase
MAGAITVRRAEPGRDTAALVGLRWQWGLEKGRAPAGSTEPSPEFAAQFATWIAANAPTHTAFLALDDDRPIGMAWLATVERPPDVDVPVRRSGFVQSVFVLPALRDDGVGAALLAAVVATARDRGLQYLLVSPSERSVPFYRRNGFAGDHRLSLPLI